MNMGSPSPGMNAAVRSVVRTLFCDDNFNVILISEGFDGLLNDEVEYANWGSVSGFLGQGGSILGTNRFIVAFLQLGLKSTKLPFWFSGKFPKTWQKWLNSSKSTAFVDYLSLVVSKLVLCSTASNLVDRKTFLSSGDQTFVVEFIDEKFHTFC